MKQTIYTEGICGDGAAILKNGVFMTIEEIMEDLRKISTLEKLVKDASKFFPVDSFDGEKLEWLKAAGLVE